MSDHDRENRIGDALLCGDRDSLDLLARGDSDYVNEWQLLAAIGIYPLATVQWLIDQGVSVVIETDDGFPAMHTAIDREEPGKYEIVRALIKAGADINERGMNTWTPLHRAAVFEDVELIELLLELGADPEIETTIDYYATAEEEARSMGKNIGADTIQNWIAENPGTL